MERIGTCSGMRFGFELSAIATVRMRVGTTQAEPHQKVVP